jgi:hypothetical protein
MSKPQRLLFKSIEKGDRLKLEARSNISASGGGARDMRLPHRPFQPAVVKMFPKVVQESRRRDGKTKLLDLRKATLVWTDEQGQIQTKEITYEPPTTARPSEGRITRIHEIPPLAVAYLPPKTDGRAIALFIQDSDGRLRAHYTSHAALVNPPRPWYPLARDTILAALKATPDGHSASGWVDFTTGLNYIHG